ncbi:MAG: Na+/H+ antiporter NhaA, partial [Deltaproteobacteria bacterium]
SLFVSNLSFTSPALLDNSKLGIMLGSLLSAAVGLLFLGIDVALHRNRQV